ncbi:MAG: NAD(P)-dependent oxidoreductase [bacterium]
MPFVPSEPSQKDSLSAQPHDNQFSDLHTSFSLQKAIAEAGRCLYCYDAPCISACPTDIDIPTFIHQIKSSNFSGSAYTILSQNIFGGTCARVCPTEILCQQKCVLNTSIDQPVEIGSLQRFAVDHFFNNYAQHPFKRAPLKNKTIAIIGAGPAGLSCAHRLAMLGYDSVIYEAKNKPGGLNEYGLAAYKMTDQFAQREVEFLLQIGGIQIKYQKRLGENINLQQLQTEYDAVFIGVGLANTYALGLDNEQLNGVRDAVDFIEELRQSDNLESIKPSENVIVIGAGNTAIDAAVQSKRLGADKVTLVYRRGEEHMSATEWEINLARIEGVEIKLWSAPVQINGKTQLNSVVFAKTRLDDNGKLIQLDDQYALQADCLLKAIGQQLDHSCISTIETHKGKVKIDPDYQTNLSGVFAGGDVIDSGEDLTVQAVEDGKQAAMAIDRYLSEGE